MRIWKLPNIISFLKGYFNKKAKAAEKIKIEAAEKKQRIKK